MHRTSRSQTHRLSGAVDTPCCPHSRRSQPPLPAAAARLPGCLCMSDPCIPDAKPSDATRDDAVDVCRTPGPRMRMKPRHPLYRRERKVGESRMKQPHSPQSERLTRLTSSGHDGTVQSERCRLLLPTQGTPYDTRVTFVYTPYDTRGRRGTPADTRGREGVVVPRQIKFILGIRHEDRAKGWRVRPPLSLSWGGHLSRLGPP